MTTKSIGTASRDYSTITAWHAAFPGGTGTWIGECYNDSEFNETPSIGGTSTCPETLRPATGQSAFDNNANPLKYDQSKGVGVNASVVYDYGFNVSGYATISRMQIKNPASNGNGTLKVAFSAASVVIDSSLFYTPANNPFSSNSAVALYGGASQKITNSVIIADYQHGFYLQYANATVIANCTIVAPSDMSNTQYAIRSVGSGDYPSIINCACFGFSGGFYQLTNATGSNNATDVSSVPWGSSNLTSQTYASQFTGVTSSAMDFRLKSGASLIDAGATDTTDIPGAIDIFGRARTTGNWSIGACQDGGGGSTAALLGRMFAKTSGLPAISAAVAVSARQTSGAHARGTGSYAAPQIARSSILSRGTAAPAASTALSGRSLSGSKSRSAFSLAVAIAGLSRAMTAARAVISGPGSLTARGFAMLRGGAAPSASTAVSGRMTLATKAVPNMTAQAAIAARATAQTRLSALGGYRTNLAAMSKSAATAKGVLSAAAVLAALAGRSIARASGLATFSLRTSIAARALMALRGMLGSTIVVTVFDPNGVIYDTNSCDIIYGEDSRDIIYGGDR